MRSFPWLRLLTWRTSTEILAPRGHHVNGVLLRDGDGHRVRYRAADGQPQRHVVSHGYAGRHLHVDLVQADKSGREPRKLNRTLYAADGHARCGNSLRKRAA